MYKSRARKIWDFEASPRHKKAKFRYLILKRDKCTCNDCGYSHERGIGLQIHHIVKKSDNVELEYDQNNVITLCILCHKKIHGFFKKGD